MCCHNVVSSSSHTFCNASRAIYNVELHVYAVVPDAYLAGKILLGDEVISADQLGHTPESVVSYYGRLLNAGLLVVFVSPPCRTPLRRMRCTTGRR